MACSHPHYIVLTPFINNETGKRQIKFIGDNPQWNQMNLEARYGVENVFPVPCGKCFGCRLDKSQDWAVRCVMESLQYDDNCFITLTYNDENLPSDKKLVKSHVQEFIREVRRQNRVRYLISGEYGSQTGRPHYHAILFGFKPNDLVLIQKTEIGNYLYKSAYLSSIWDKGFVSVGEFTPESARYVAGYTAKKVGDDNGFLLCSTKPGIGAEYLINNLDQIIKYDSFTGKGLVQSRVPRYFQRLCERLGINIDEYKSKRSEKTDLYVKKVMSDYGLTKDKSQVFEVNKSANLRKEKLFKRSL